MNSTFKPGRESRKTISQQPAAEVRQDGVREQQVERHAMFVQPESLHAIRSLEHSVAGSFENRSDQCPDVVIVLDEQDRFCAANGRG